MRRGRWTTVALLAAIGCAAHAATVRGKLLRGTGAAAGVTVTLVNAQTHASASPVHSAANGMYYFSNVPEGTYTLEVWTTTKGPPVPYPNIQVKGRLTDVGPITVP